MDTRPSGANTPPVTPETADPLGTIISLLRPQTVLSKIVSGAGEWSVRKPRFEDPAFCLILQGCCILAPEGVGSFELGEGDFVLLPSMPGFTLASDPGLQPTDVALDPSRESRYGIDTGPATMRMLGGYFRFERANARLVVRLLPPIIHVRHEEAGASRLRRIVQLIGDEADEQRPGRDLILERLAEVLLVEALRIRPAPTAAKEQGLLAGLADPALALALREIHFDVAHPWTVADLARSARMSRAVFADRFARTVGMTPMHYLIEWRMAIAKDMLRRERAPLAEVAERVGYQSASAFSTAFARVTGRSPSAFARSTD